MTSLHTFINNYNKHNQRNHLTDSLIALAEGFEPSVQLMHTTLAGWHLKPTRTRKHKWAGPDSNWRRPRSADLQSAAIATMRPTRGVTTGNRTRMCRATICRTNHCSIATAAFIGIGPISPVSKTGVFTIRRKGCISSSPCWNRTNTPRVRVRCSTFKLRSYMTPVRFELSICSLRGYRPNQLD